MTTQIGIDIICGNRDVTDDDRDRAENAALAVLEARDVTVDAARAEFRRQWAWLETGEAEAQGLAQDYRYLAGLAVVWWDAEAAADHALTEGWAVPGRAHCAIY